MIIGLNGKKGAGKDTVGAYLVEKHGFTRISFAEKLKDSAAALFDIDPALWDEWKNDEFATVQIRLYGNHLTQKVDVPSELTVREFLQRYGTEAHRDIFGFDFWVDAAFSELDSLRNIDPYGDFVFTDARFENEAQAISDRSGFMWRVFRDDIEDGDTHISEAEIPIDMIDVVINNKTGELEDTYAQVDKVLEALNNPTMHGWQLQFDLPDKNVPAEEVQT